MATADDQLLEHVCEQPILQLISGKFYSYVYSHFTPQHVVIQSHSTHEVQLAVLHPHTAVLYRVDAADAAGSATAYLSLTTLHNHHLPGPAANMVAGRFGGTRGLCISFMLIPWCQHAFVAHTHVMCPESQTLCVQTMDGLACFFRGGVLLFQVTLPGFLVPGPLCFCSSTDALLTINAALELQSFSFQALQTTGAQPPT